MDVQDPSAAARLGLAAVLIGALALAGCAKSEPTSTVPSSATSADPATADPATTSSEVTSGPATATATDPSASSDSASSASSSSAASTSTTGAEPALADVLSVSADQTSWSVELRSPDLGCGQYADWWEVLTPEGALIYRRILAHSHVDEQPFTRSGGPVDVEAGDIVIVRAHMNPGGYGGQALRGSMADGFTADPSIDAGFAAALSTSPPLPDGCAF